MALRTREHLVTAAAIDESPQRVDVDGTSVVVARLGDRVLAAVDRCPHRGAPLSAGTVEHDCIVCPYHGWRFDADGEIAGIPAIGGGAKLPGRARLRKVTAVEHDGGVDIDASTVAAAAPTPTRVMSNDAPQLRAGWHPVCRSHEITVADDATVELLGQEWTVRRASNGALAADGAHSVVDRHGHVWLAPDEPLAELLDISEFDEPDWHFVPMPRVEGRYGVGLLLDNQLDAGHFSFVHRGTFGADSDAALPPYGVVRDGLGFEARMRVPIAARNDVMGAAGDRPLLQYRNMTYRYRAPSTLFLRLDYEEMGGSTGILFCFTPLDGARARMDVDLLFRHPDGFTDEQLAERLRFETAVVAEDLALQDRFEFLDLPLDLTAEIHTKADKSSVEMRRIVAEIYAAVEPDAEVAMPILASTDVSSA